MKINDYLLACAPYLNKDLVMGGHPTTRQTGQTSDNGSMFTAEYIRIANDIDHTFIPENNMWEFENSGQLFRYITNSSPLDLSPDDYLGFLNYCVTAGSHDLAQRVYGRGKDNWGSYTTPWSQAGFMWRQPQLLYAAIVAAGLKRWYNPIHHLLALYTALVIAIAGHGVSSSVDQDCRRLTWHLIRIVEKSSLLVDLASKVFFNRLRKQYGDQGMRLVFARYFDVNHPFATYAVNPWEMK